MRRMLLALVVAYALALVAALPDAGAAEAAQAIAPTRAIDAQAYQLVLGDCERALTRALAGAHGRLDDPRVRAACTDAAAALELVRVRWEGEDITPDPALVAQLRAGHAGTALRRIATARGQLASGVADGPGGAPRSQADARSAARADPQALGRIQSDQQEQSDAAGGELGGMPIHDNAELRSWGERMLDALSWLSEKLSSFWEWLRHLFQVSAPGSTAGMGSMTVLVLVLVGVVVVVLVGFALARRPTAAPAARVAAAARLALDADPASKPADEWRRLAEQLAAGGRWREAVRAHYHAVLVMSWSAGLIVHRVGRTNWEYASMLPPSWAERARFIDLTRGYERAWYGGQADGESCRAFAERVDQLSALLKAGWR